MDFGKLAINDRMYYFLALSLVALIFAFDFLISRSLGFVHLFQPSDVHLISKIILSFKQAAAAWLALTAIAIYVTPKSIYRFMLGASILAAFSILILMLFAMIDTLFGKTDSMHLLLIDAFFIYLINIMIFTVWYWFLDIEPQALNAQKTPTRTSFLFFQQTTVLPGWEGWTPHFSDYFYLSCNTFSTFGPTDVMNLKRVSRLSMVVHVVISIFILTVLVARSVAL